MSLTWRDPQSSSDDFFAEMDPWAEWPQHLQGQLPAGMGTPGPLPLVEEVAALTSPAFKKLDRW